MLKRKVIVRGFAVVITVLNLLLIAYLVIANDIKKRTEKIYAFKEKTIAIPSDSLSIARGKHLSVIKGCQDCHGADLGGKLMIDDPGLGVIVASNLTGGKGGLPQDYGVQDWMRALRHGVGRSGKALILMPSHETALLSKADLSALIAYCRQVDRVDRPLPANKLGPVANMMGYLGKMPLLSVEKINHVAPLRLEVDTAPGPALGEYLAISCSGCHRADFKGGDPIAPGMPEVPNITSSGAVGKWTQEQFISTLRTGKTPTGHQLKNEEMPWMMTAQYDLKELVSLYLYLRTIK
ncbi:c-type cytochrome [Dyadobacter tibetensis]|uniref:c-type cytochrome n=1 Tax=Dyadobacter tibetensis TaxID=1211851 RepID=UPI0004AF5580|nr:c-type cytochrome [Dyadobacter tibetensis]